MASVALRNLQKTYLDPQSRKNVTAVNDLNLEVRDGEFLVLVGPSGCGKSTALRMIAGLETVSGGEVRIGERVVNNLAPGDRDIAMVFQNYALYPHLSVYENMAFGLKLRRLPGFLGRLGNAQKTRETAQEIDREVRRSAELLGITHLLDRKPKALSGGQRQRVALGRAIVRNPQVFLMDEPLSNLDAKLRVQTRAELIKLHRRLGVTTIYVTHDQVEALTMGQRIAVMKDGVLQQCAPPLELYHHPVNQFVAGFIGTPSMNFLPARANGDPADKSGHAVGVTLDAGAFCLRVPSEHAQLLANYAGQTVTLGIRPENIFDASLAPSTRNASLSEPIRVSVDVIEPMGAKSLAYLRAGESTLVAELDSATLAREGGTIDIVLDTNTLHFFDAQSEATISHGEVSGAAISETANSE